MAPLTNVEGGSFFYFYLQINLRKFTDKNKKMKRKRTTSSRIFYRKSGRLTNAFELDLSVADPFHCDVERSGMSQCRKGYFDKVTNVI